MHDDSPRVHCVTNIICCVPVHDELQTAVEVCETVARVPVKYDSCAEEFGLLEVYTDVSLTLYVDDLHLSSPFDHHLKNRLVECRIGQALRVDDVVREEGLTLWESVDGA